MSKHFISPEIVIYTSILNEFKSHISETNTPSYLVVPDICDSKLASICGLTTTLEDIVDEETETIVTTWSVEESTNIQLDSTLHSFLSTLSEEDAINAMIDIAICLMDFLANETFNAYDEQDYLRALCFAKAFERQFNSVLSNVGLIFDDYGLGVYLCETIPFIEAKCNQVYNTESE